MTRNLLILLMLVALPSYSQNKMEMAKSDSLFAMGVELYNSGRYKEAIPYFTESDKIDKTELDSTSNRRDYSAIWLASCYHKLGNESKAREIDSIYYKQTPVDRRLTVESDRYLQLVEKAYSEGDWESALHYIESCAETEKKALGPNSVWYANTLVTWADILLYIGESDSCVNLLNTALQIFSSNEFVSGEGSCYMLLGIRDKRQGLYDTAISYFLKAVDRFHEAKMKADEGSIFIELAECSNYNGNYKEATEYAMKAQNIFADELHAPDDEYVFACINSAFATAYGWLQEPEKSHKYASDAISIFEKNGDRESESYLYAQESLIYTAKTLNMEETPALTKNVKEIIENSIFAGTIEHANVLKQYCDFNPDNLDSKELISIRRQIADMFASTIGKDTHDYVEALLAICNASDMKNKDDAKRIQDILLEAKGIYDSDIEICHNCRTNMLLFLGDIETLLYEDYKKGEEYILESKRIIEAENETQTPIYIQTLCSLAQLYYNSARNDKAVYMYRKCMKLCEQMELTNSTYYTRTLSGLSQYYNSVGDTYNMDKISKRLLEISEKNDKLTDYWMEMHNVTYKFRNGEYEWVRQHLSKTIEDAKGKDDRYIEYSFAILMKCFTDFATGDTSKTEETMLEAIRIIESIIGTDNMFVLQYQNALVQLYVQQGRSDDALELSKYILGKLREKENYNPESYADLLAQQINIQYNSGNWEEIYHSIQELSDLLESIIKNNFRSMTYQERSLFWNKYSIWYNTILPNYVHQKQDNRLYEVAYDGVLLSKGILLNSEIEVKKLIAENGNKEAAALYEEIQAKRLSLNKMMTAGGISDEYNALNTDIQKQERRLMSISKEYGDYTKNLSVTWTDVKNNLKEGDIAVEFVSVPINPDSTVYIALTLKPHYHSPNKTVICAGSKIEHIGKDNLYTTTELADLVWRPLKEELDGVTNVYFSPSGILYNTAIEYARMNDGGIISSKYNMYRLSSTREIVITKEKSDYLSAVLYGGMEYNADRTTLAETNMAQEDLEVFRHRAVIDELSLRGGVANLEGAKKEVEEIEKLFEATGSEYHLFTDVEGTEESFKKLSNTGKTLLHIATHGFYWDEKDIQNRNVLDLSFLMNLHEDVNIPIEDKLLTHSGLLFAGANTALQKKDIPDNQEDGILTSQELSGLDFRGLDLVVLSACQTGLGEITGDGVFGLQRGFKKAGAQTLMMSLWKVEDNATRMLMSKFYDCLISGKSKFESLREAQRYVKEYETEKETAPNTVEKVRPYQDPKFWAAFILLDATD